MICYFWNAREQRIKRVLRLSTLLQRDAVGVLKQRENHGVGFRGTCPQLVQRKKIIMRIEYPKGGGKRRAPRWKENRKGP